MIETTRPTSTMILMAQECAHSVIEHLETELEGDKYVTKGWGDSGTIFTQLVCDMTSCVEVEISYSDDEGFDIDVKYAVSDANRKFFNTTITNMLYNAVKYYHGINTKALIEEACED